MINWAAQIWQLRGLVFLLAGDLGECRKGFGVGVVVEHVLAGPLTCAEIPAGGDYPCGCGGVVAGTAQSGSRPEQGLVRPGRAVGHANTARVDYPAPGGKPVKLHVGVPADHGLDADIEPGQRRFPVLLERNGKCERRSSSSLSR